MTARTLLEGKAHSPRLGTEPALRIHAVIALLVVVALVRVVWLARQPPFMDEKSTAAMATLPASVIVRQFHLDAREFGQMPLAFLLARAGVVALGPTLGALRAPFFAVGLLGVGFLFSWGRRLEGLTVGLLAMILVATSPAHVSYSHVARFYPVMFLAAAVSMAALLEMLSAPSAGRAALWAAAMLVGVYDHYGFWLSVAGGVLLAIAVLLFPSLAGIPDGERRGHRWRLSRAVVVALLLIATGYLPWATRALQFATAGTARMGAQVTRKKDPGQLARLAATRPLRATFRPELHRSPEHLHDLSNPLVVGRTIAIHFCGGRGPALLLVPLFVMGALRPSRRVPAWRALQVSAWGATFGILAAMGHTDHMFHPRYVSYLLPLFILGVARGIVASGDLARRAAGSAAGDEGATPASTAMAALVLLVVVVETRAVLRHLAAPANAVDLARIERTLSLGHMPGPGTPSARAEPRSERQGRVSAP